MDPKSENQRVIVAGFGPVGRVQVDRLEALGQPVTLIELNSDTVFKQNQLGRHAVLGDASDPVVLAQADIIHAHALLLTMPDEDAALRACIEARKLAPNIFIAARTNYISRGLLASANGADYVVIEELVTAQAMADAVVDQLAPHASGPESED